MWNAKPLPAKNYSVLGELLVALWFPILKGIWIAIAITPPSIHRWEAAEAHVAAETASIKVGNRICPVPK